MNISYDWYKIFYYAAFYRNITAAAQQLFISQPAVSQSIKQLESALGCRLFLRTAKGVTLTAEGQVLYQHIAKGMEQIRLGEKKLQSQMNLESGEIHIGASDMTLEYFLLPFLENFHHLYPKIKISITNGPTPETIRLLREDVIDFGIISEPVSDVQEFSVVPVKLIEDVFICGKELYKTLLRPCPLISLPSLPLILLEKNTSTREYMDEFFKENGVTISPEFELATSRLIVQFVKRNLGVGCVVRDFAAEDLERELIYEVPLEKKVPPRHICLIHRKAECSRAAETLLELLRT